MSGQRLYDAKTGEDLGPATPEQIEASDRSDERGGQGLIRIDDAGSVVRLGDFGYSSHLRTVYTND